MKTGLEGLKCKTGLGGLGGLKSLGGLGSMKSAAGNPPHFAKCGGIFGHGYIHIS